MMKFLTSLTLILLGAIFALAQKEAVPKKVTFKDARNRFSITYSRDWQVVPPDKGFQFKLTKDFGPYGSKYRKSSSE